MKEPKRKENLTRRIPIHAEKAQCSHREPGYPEGLSKLGKFTVHTSVDLVKSEKALRRVNMCFSMKRTSGYDIESRPMNPKRTT